MKNAGVNPANSKNWSLIVAAIDQGSGEKSLLCFECFSKLALAGR